MLFSSQSPPNCLLRAAAYDSFEMSWGGRGLGVSERVATIETHWPFFLGYGGVLAFLSLPLRFWDLFVLRACLYPVYIANAPHASFASLRVRPLPIFQPALVVFNSIVQLANMHVK